MTGRLVPLGEIVGTHGLEGWLKLKPYNPETGLLSPFREVFLEKASARSSQVVRMSRPHGTLILFKLEDCDSIDQAKGWVGCTLSVAEETLDDLKPGEYYYYQILGFEVFDTAGISIGKVIRVWPKGGGDLLVVRGSSKEYLIPAVKEVIEKIDFPAAKIIISPPPGLLDLA